jgi:predicted PurR-regulated permease PerM
MSSRPIDPVPIRYAIASWVIAGIALLLVVVLHLLPALLAGLLVYELVHVIAPRLRLAHAGRVTAVALIATAVVVLLILALLGIATFLRGDVGHVQHLMQKMADIVEESRGRLPDWLVGNIPVGTDALKDAIIDWLRSHAGELRLIGGEIGRVLLHILIGMIIGAMVSLREARPEARGGPLTSALCERVGRLGDAFRNVVFAQVRISALNTVFTAIYLMGILPLMGVHLPFAKTMVAITFVTGLLPVVGNLISNTVIVIVSLNVSLPVAGASLVFLVVIHKLEYFLNAKIVGAHIRAKAWELLVAMLAMEAAFGVGGLVAAPIYYAYLKDELAARGLI